MTILTKRRYETMASERANVSASSGLEPTATGESAEGLGAALARNRAFADSGGHVGAIVLPALRTFVVTCLDPRTDPAHFLGLQLSDAIVIRNVGGRVTDEVINDIAFIGQISEKVFPEGALFDVAVIHHTQCGAAALADESFRAEYAERVGVPEAALRGRALVDPYETVKADVLRLRAAPAVTERIRVSGHVYDVVTGLVETVVEAVGGTH
jgi:carbonic anhydrase